MSFTLWARSGAFQNPRFQLLSHSYCVLFYINTLSLSSKIYISSYSRWESCLVALAAEGRLGESGRLQVRFWEGYLRK